MKNSHKKYIIKTFKKPTLYFTGELLNDETVEMSSNKKSAKVYDGFEEADKSIREIDTKRLLLEIIN